MICSLAQHEGHTADRYFLDLVGANCSVENRQRSMLEVAGTLEYRAVGTPDLDIRVWCGEYIQSRKTERRGAVCRPGSGDDRIRAELYLAADVGGQTRTHNFVRHNAEDGHGDHQDRDDRESQTSSNEHRLPSHRVPDAANRLDQTRFAVSFKLLP